MSVDEDLAGRVRTLLADEPDLTERRMFGGLAVLVGGRMALAVGARGELMVRAGTEDVEELLARRGVEPVVMRGRRTRGWVDVQAEVLQDDEALQEWVSRGVLAARGVEPPR